MIFLILLSPLLLLDQRGNEVHELGRECDGGRDHPEAHEDEGAAEVGRGHGADGAAAAAAVVVVVVGGVGGLGVFNGVLGVPV